MDAVEAENISEYLQRWNAGDTEAFGQMIPVVYGELKRRARAQLRLERPGHTLQTSAIVHETYLKFADQRQVAWRDRHHFFIVASHLMRRILVDYARTKHRIKRGGVADDLTLDSAIKIAVETSDIDLLDLNSCLARLEEIDPQQSKIVELRYFAGCSVEETSEILGIAPRTVKRDWAAAKAWLLLQLK
ncbi:MAG: sigma-70 family RNA polymerase sigma factor [Pyrinomonadaceae bacterium]